MTKSRRPGARMPRPRKRFGQHFLEASWVAKVVAAIDPRPEDRFVEIGPGRGALTLALAASGARVAALEIDRDLVAGLRDKAPPNVDVIEADVLTFDFRSLVGPGGPLAASGDGLRVAGNLPYNISSPILFRLYRLAAQGLPVVDATLMLQREVADRVTAVPGSKAYGPVAISTALHVDARRALELPPGAFRPAPRVRSTLVQLRFRRPAPRLPAALEPLVRGLFTRRRKTVLNALRPLAAAWRTDAATLLARVGIDPGRRPETLQVTELVRLAEILPPDEA